MITKTYTETMIRNMTVDEIESLFRTYQLNDTSKNLFIEKLLEERDRLRGCLDDISEQIKTELGV